MAINQNIRSCTHIKVNGVRCASPALRSEHFCYFHQRMIRGVATPPKSRLHPIALIENEEAIQASLMEVINALVRNHIDLRRAQLILRALHIAVKNSPRVHFHSSPREMVREVPDYPAVLAPKKPAPQAISAESLAANATAVAYLKAVELKSAEAKAAQAKVAAEKLAEVAKLFEPAKAGAPQAGAGAAPAAPALRKPPGRITVGAAARKSAYGRSG
jgi:hypothetical protein